MIETVKNPATLKKPELLKLPALSKTNPLSKIGENAEQNPPTKKSTIAKTDAMEIHPVLEDFFDDDILCGSVDARLENLGMEADNLE